MSLELLAFELRGVTIAVALEAVREVCPAQPDDVNLSAALGLGHEERSEEARTLLVGAPSAVRLCVGARTELLTVDAGSVVDMPALIRAHPAFGSLVLHEDRVIVLLDPARITGERA